MNKLLSLILILVAAVLAPPVSGQIPPSDVNDEATLLKEMTAFNPDYIKLHRARRAQVEELERQVLAREAADRSTACSHQILEEIEWLDDSTADFMVSFYTNLLGNGNPANKVSKAEALRQAQLSLRRDPRYPHPFFWAPFVLIGDGR